MTTEGTTKLTEKIIGEIGLNDVQEGDLRCRSVRIAATKKLSQIIVNHVLQRDRIAYPSESAAPLFHFAEQVALRGDIGMGEMKETREAVTYIIQKMIETYQLPDNERKRIYDEALIILVATHRLLDV